jgi:hypothetical protein
MEFHLLSKYKVDLSSLELWDHTKAARLIPFRKSKRWGWEAFNDPISEGNAFIPIFPYPIQDDYDRLRFLQSKIVEDERLLATSDEEEWGRYAANSKDQGRAREKARLDIDAARTEAGALEEKFRDLSRLYERYELTQGQIENFMEQLKAAYYRRDNIESLKLDTQEHQEEQESSARNIDRGWRKDLMVEALNESEAVWKHIPRGNRGIRTQDSVQDCIDDAQGALEAVIDELPTDDKKKTIITSEMLMDEELYTVEGKIKRAKPKRRFCGGLILKVLGAKRFVERDNYQAAYLEACELRKRAKRQ